VCKLKLYAFNERIYCMQRLFLFVISMLLLPGTIMIAQAQEAHLSDENRFTKISQQLLLTAKRREPADSVIQFLQQISPDDLYQELNNDTKKKTFWLNIYNAFTQLALAQNPDQYKKRGQFFGQKNIVIAGERLSLDRIEHGLLRRSKTKWSMGYFNRLFPSSFERKHRVDSVDYRIHFALNCGAKSCPPIAFYRAEQLDKQLDLATRVYLRNEAVYDTIKNEIALPAIMGWFRGDFGGKRKMTELLRKISVIPNDANPSIKFKKYDWNLYLDNYKTD
jgi:hypothetical protein